MKCSNTEVIQNIHAILFYFEINNKLLNVFDLNKNFKLLTSSCEVVVGLTSAVDSLIIKSTKI